MAEFFKNREIRAAILFFNIGGGGVTMDRGHFGHGGVILDICKMYVYLVQ